MKIADYLDKIGSSGAIITAAMAPCCFPFLGAIWVSLGFSAVESFAPQLQFLVQAFVVLAWIGAIIAYKSNRSIFPLVLGTIGLGFCIFHYYFYYSERLVYLAFVALMTSGLLNTFNRMKTASKKPILKSTITCPNCGNKETEKMPTGACQFFWDCPNCGGVLKPKRGDCCVYCSYGSVPCPPIQLESKCCE